MADIHNLIAAIVPDVYCDPSVRKEVKEKAKKEGYLKAAERAKRISLNELSKIDVLKEKPLDARGLKEPYEAHKLVYDSAATSLEPLYFWILDFLNAQFKKIDKITDNFVSSPGSAHFSELGMKATKMQEEAMKSLTAVNAVLKSLLNILYDLKEFKLRLDLYDMLKSGSAEERNSAMLSLKQIWLDNVDIKRGTTAIKAMAQQFDYVTIIDAFMAARSLEDVTKKPEDGGLDLNERVRRILQQRFGEFLKWLKESEIEMRKRFEIEKKYLRSQYNVIQLYSRWAKPYLKAAHALEQNMSPSAALVTTFNTLILELALLAQEEYKPDDDVSVGDLPELFKTLELRKYFSVIVLELKFRGIPQRVGQGYSFGGRSEVVFTSYGLNERELGVLKEEIEKDNFQGVLTMIEGTTKDSLEQIEEDINEFLGEKKDEKEKEETDSEDTNPFTALFSFFKSEKKKDKEEKDIKPDSLYEKVLRSQAIINARDKCKTVFDTYKKAHEMPAF